MSTERPPPRPDTIVLVCDVAGLVDPDLRDVHALARLQLAALRAGGRIRLRGAPGELVALLDLVGLGEVLPG